jgi:hypothetical protein
MMKILLAFLLSVYSCNALSAAPLDNDSAGVFELEMSAADAIILVFEKGQVSPAELDQLLQLDDIKTSIRHTANFNKDATVEAYKESLLDVLAGNEPDTDPFQFAAVKRKLPEIRELYAKIKKDPAALMREVFSQMAGYMPEGIKLDGVAHLLVGGGSDGFATGGDFYVGLHFFGNDYVGLKLLMAHEIYHLAQNQFFPLPVDSWKGMTQIQAALNETLVEGSATLVGDPTGVNGGSYVEWYRKKFDRNLARIDQNFRLLELMLYRLSKDSGSRFGQYYQLGFSGSWDSPLYFVGYKMAKTILDHRGKPRLVELYSEGPIAFFREYIALYNARPESKIIHFSPAIENIILSD